MRLTLGGVERTIKFNFGTLKHIGDVTKDDPLKFVADFGDPATIYKYVTVLVYAGLKSAKENVTYDQVDEWVQELNLTDSHLIINAFTEAYSSPEPSKNGVHSGEAGQHTQQAAHV